MIDKKKSEVSLLLVTFSALFLELIFIRFLPANVVSLWYFSNIVLISSFFGIGFGALIAKRFKDLFKWFPVALLFVVTIVVSLRWFEVVIPNESGEWMWNFHYRGNNFGNFIIHLNIYTTLAVVFILNSSLFVFLGQKIALLMAEFKPERAYGLDLVGSILGVASFGLLVFLGGWLGTPMVWFAVLGAAVLWLIKEDKKFLYIGAFSFLIVISIAGASSMGGKWSPYYFVQAQESQSKSFRVYVNRFFYQEAVNFNEFEALKWKYLLPYHFAVPKKLLILGAGSGNDVVTANSVGVKHIDAVEIDPYIVDLGVNRNIMSPYQNPNVSIHIDDARSFLKKSDTKYDMIILGTLDSHALLSAMSTVRLDNFVYTLESLRDIKNHLSDKGIAVLQFSAPNEEFALRLLEISSTAFSDTKKVAYWGDDGLFNFAFLAGPGITEEPIKSLDTNLFTRVSIPEPKTVNTLPTDDWPYLYLRERVIPTPYLKAIGILMSITLVSILIFFRKKRGLLSASSLNFFFLGAAFLLIETKTITSLSLLFGSTWVVNILVFGAILTMLFLANLYVSNKEIERVGKYYMFLFASLLVNFLLPTGYFVGGFYWIGSIAEALIATTPIFFAAIIFSQAFKKVKEENIGMMYGVNLTGAVFGGFFEYTSMIFGLKMLYLVAVLFYVISYFSSGLSRGLGLRDS